MSPVFGSAVPGLLTEQVRPWQLVMNVGTGAALPDGSTIVTSAAPWSPVTFHSSRDRQRHRGTVPRGRAVKVLVGSGRCR